MISMPKKGTCVKFLSDHAPAKRGQAALVLDETTVVATCAGRREEIRASPGELKPQYPQTDGSPLKAGERVQLIRRVPADDAWIRTLVVPGRIYSLREFEGRLILDEASGPCPALIAGPVDPTPGVDCVRVTGPDPAWLVEA